MKPSFFNEIAAADGEPVPLSPRRAGECLQGGATLVDIRPDFETSFRVFDVPRLFYLPYATYRERFSEIPRGAPLVVADNVGTKSPEVARFLVSQGYGDVAFIVGGVVAWAQGGHPLKTDPDYELVGGCACKLKPKKRSPAAPPAGSQDILGARASRPQPSDHQVSGPDMPPSATGVFAGPPSTACEPVKKRGGPFRILFLCTGNSCRSQMAEGWARHLRGREWEPRSAGVVARGLDPRAVRAMAEVGVDISGHTSKTVGALPEVAFDIVVTLCGHASDTCPVFPGGVRRVHAGFDDPPALASSARTEEDALSHYRRVRDEVRAWVESFDLVKTLTGE